MKTKTFIAGCVLGMLLQALAMAGDDNKPKAASAEKGKSSEQQPAQQDKKTSITGSYIKRDIHRSGLITNGKDQVLVLDSDAIARSGASELKQVLIRSGIH